MLEWSDACHNNAHSPSSTRSRGAERRKREAEEQNARNSNRRPPGRAVGSKCVTRKIPMDGPPERRSPASCGGCRSTDLIDKVTTYKQCNEIILVQKTAQGYVFDDYACGACGACGRAVKASRKGAAEGTSLGPGAVAAVGVVRGMGHASAGAASGMLDQLFEVEEKRTATEGCIEALADILHSEAEAIRADAEARAEPGEMDETDYLTMVLEGDGAGGGAAVRRKKKGYAWAVADSRSVRVHVSATRAAAVIPEHFSDRLRAPTAADGYSPYDDLEVRQRDHIHRARRAQGGRRRGGAGENAAALSALHGMLAGALRRIRDDHKSCPSGAFQDPEIFRRADEYEAEVLGIADSYEKAGHAKMAVMLRNAAPLVAHCLRFPGLSPTTNDIERVML